MCAPVVDGRPSGLPLGEVRRDGEVVSRFWDACGETALSDGDDSERGALPVEDQGCSKVRPVMRTTTPTDPSGRFCTGRMGLGIVPETPKLPLNPILVEFAQCIRARRE